MALKSSSPVRISPWIGLPLSLFMIVIATITFVGATYGNGSEWPVLTTFRDKRVSPYYPHTAYGKDAY